MNEDLRLLRNLILRNNVQIRKTLVQKRRNVVSLLKNFRVYIVLYELKKFLKDFLNVFDLLKVRVNDGHLGHELLLFLLVSSRVYEEPCLTFQIQI